MGTGGGWESDHRLAVARVREVALQDELRALQQEHATFLGALAREVRAPLTAVLGLAYTLEREDLELDPATAREWAARISSRARKLARVVDGLATLDRLSRAGAEAVRRPTDLRRLVDELIARTDLAGRAAAVLVAPDVEVALVDPDQTEAALEALLDNVRRHTPAGTAVRVEVRQAADGDVLAVVEDAGPGVPDEDKTRVFEPFQRGEPAAEAGLGVGLALVGRVAALHGGRAWVEDAPGGGASFRLELPAWSSAAPTRVLVVDWDMRCDWARSELLVQAGFEISTCGGLDHIRALDSCPLVADGACALVTGADAFVFSLVGHTPAALQVLAEYRRRAPGIPMVVEVEVPDLEHFEDLLEGCVVVPAPLNAERVRDLLPEALGR